MTNCVILPQTSARSLAQESLNFTKRYGWKPTALAKSRTSNTRDTHFAVF